MNNATMLLFQCSAICILLWLRYGGEIGLYTDRDGDRELSQISDADIKCAQTELLGTQLGNAMEADAGTSATQLYDLHLAPFHSSHASSEGLADGFLRGEATS